MLDVGFDFTKWKKKKFFIIFFFLPPVKQPYIPYIPYIFIILILNIRFFTFCLNSNLRVSQLTLNFIHMTVCIWFIYFTNMSQTNTWHWTIEFTPYVSYFFFFLPPVKQPYIPYIPYIFIILILKSAIKMHVGLFVGL